MNNLNFVYPEIFFSLSIMFLLILGVFKKNSSNLINTLSILTLIGALVLIFSYPTNTNLDIFNGDYKIDFVASYMKILTLDGLVVRDIESRGLSSDGDQLVWDGKNNKGKIVPSGVYLIAIIGSDGKNTYEKITVLNH